MKKFTLLIGLMLLSNTIGLAQSAAFTGLNANYCSSDAPAILLPTTPGGTFSGPGVSGNTFTPSAVGDGEPIIRYDLPYTYSSIAYGPKPTAGTKISLADDQVSGALPIGFNFKFYGNVYDKFYISSNGFISFNPAVNNGCCTEKLLPTNDATNNIIAAVWSDLNPALGGSITYYTFQSNAPAKILVISFQRKFYCMKVQMLLKSILQIQRTTTSKHRDWRMRQEPLELQCQAGTVQYGRLTMMLYDSFRA